MGFGVSQIDAGSRIELGGYTEAGDAQVMEREQFQLGDIRSLDDVMQELMIDGYVPSFCTACYRLGRTGEHFMEFAIPGFIQNLCTPNALTTLMEYLVDYASDETCAAGMKAIAAGTCSGCRKASGRRDLVERLQEIRENGGTGFVFRDRDDAPHSPLRRHDRSVGNRLARPPRRPRRCSVGHPYAAGDREFPARRAGRCTAAGPRLRRRQAGGGAHQSRAGLGRRGQVRRH